MSNKNDKDLYYKNNMFAKWMKKIKPELFDTFQYSIDLENYQNLKLVKN